jgi:hypothetical protein
MPSATAIAYAKPEHTAWISKAAEPLLMPSLFCSRHAVLGKTKSGVEVATMIRSIACASMPAASMARCDAASARSLVV